MRSRRRADSWRGLAVSSKRRDVGISGKTRGCAIEDHRRMEDSVVLGLRGVAVGLVLALTLAGVGLPGRARSALLPMLTCLFAYVLRSAPQARAWPVELVLPLSVGALLFPLAFWWLVHSAFDDRA